MTTNKRRDSKNRILRVGELQRKDGRYEFRYKTLDGIQKSVYSWRLEKYDLLPHGKKDGPPLRDLEKSIQKDLEDGINFQMANTINVGELFDKLIEIKNLKASTKISYTDTYHKYIQPYIGKKPIAKITPLTIAGFYKTIQQSGCTDLSLLRIESLLRTMFDLALFENLIRQNPITPAHMIYRVKEVKTEKRNALTIDQQKVLFQYLHGKPRWHDIELISLFLIGTGLRISEMAALQWSDCNFENDTINVCKAIDFTSLRAKMTKIITTTKSENSQRTIPMFPFVKDVLLEIKQIQTEHMRVSPEINGYSDFVFINRVNNIITISTLCSRFKKLVNNYNAEEIEKAQSDNRKPVLLPTITAHVFRHTFATRLLDSGADLKVISSFMGHASISITGDTYTDISEAQISGILENINEKFQVITS